MHMLPLNTCPAYANFCCTIFLENCCSFLQLFSDPLYLVLCLSSWFLTSSDNTIVQKHWFFSLDSCSLTSFHNQCAKLCILTAMNYFIHAHPSAWNAVSDSLVELLLKPFCTRTFRQIYSINSAIICHVWGDVAANEMSVIPPIS